MPIRNSLTILIAAIVSLACYAKAYHNRYLSTISHAMEIIEDNYVEKVEGRELFENAMRGMVNSLDEYSDYIGPDFFDQFRQTIDQEFVGIGVVVEGPPQASELKVVTPVYDSPAHRAGMRSGDLILQIDGETTAGMELTLAVKKMKGPVGTTVKLQIRHVNDENPTELTIARDRVRTKSVLGDTLQPDGRWEYFLRDEPRIGYLRITTFGEFTAGELQAVLPFAEHPIDALILDLRGNAGGLLTAAVDTCDLFLDEGLIVSIRGREGRIEDEYWATPETTLFPRATPLIVLVDRYSASASEIVAACLQDHGRAVILGERTWGKGTVQNVIPLERGTSALKLTTASYWRPSGKNIHRSRKATDADDWGVHPTEGLELALTDDQCRQLYEQFRLREVLHGIDSAEGDVPPPAQPPEPTEDRQLQKALDYLQKEPAPDAT